MVWGFMLIRGQVLFVFVCPRLILIIHFDKLSHFCVKIGSAVLGGRRSLFGLQKL